MTDHHLTEAQWLRLKREGEMPGGLGEMFQVACNVTPETSVLQARRVGLAGRGLESRVGVFVQDSEEMYATVYISAAEARQVAAALLNVADEIDGAVPLAFFPRTPGESDEPLTPVEIVAQAHLRLVGGFAIVTGDTAATSHAFDTPTRVKVMTAYVAEDGIPCALVGSVDGSPMVQIVGLVDLKPQSERGAN